MNHRLQRLRNLRQLAAPAWIIKSEQIALVLMREQRKVAGIGRQFSKRQGELYERHVTPLLEGKD